MSIRPAPCDRLTNAVINFLPNNKVEWAALSLSCASIFFSTEAALAAWTGYVGYKWAATRNVSFERAFGLGSGPSGPGQTSYLGSCEKELSAPLRSGESPFSQEGVLQTRPNPNAVFSIYTPPHPSPQDLDNLVQYENQIEHLRKDPSVMGLAFVIDRQNNDVLVPVYIQCSKNPEEFTACFTVHRLSDNKSLGFAHVKPFLKSNQYLKNYWLVMRPSQYEGYGNSQEETSKILLDQVTSGGEYKNIGILLNKAIHQEFANQCECRMIIDAVRNTHPYHYRLGFRSFNSEQNRLYASYVERRERPETDLGSVPMYLPDRARRLWQDEIRNFPIGFPTTSNPAMASGSGTTNALL